MRCVFLFNIRNHSSEVINIQRREEELNILPRVNNFDIKQKKVMEYLFYYMPPTPNKIWQVKANKTHEFFFVKLSYNIFNYIS